MKTVIKMYTPFSNIPCQPVQSRYTLIEPNTPCNAKFAYIPVKANTCSYLTYGKLRKATYEPYTLLSDVVDEVPVESNKIKCNCGM